MKQPQKPNLVQRVLHPIGHLKVSEVLPVLELISADWNLNLAVLPEKAQTVNKGTSYKFIELGRSFTIASRILKNSVRHN